MVETSGGPSDEMAASRRWRPVSACWSGFGRAVADLPKGCACGGTSEAPSGLSVSARCGTRARRLQRRPGGREGVRVGGLCQRGPSKPDVREGRVTGRSLYQRVADYYRSRAPAGLPGVRQPLGSQSFVMDGSQAGCLVRASRMCHLSHAVSQADAMGYASNKRKEKHRQKMDDGELRREENGSQKKSATSQTVDTRAFGAGNTLVFPRGEISLPRVLARSLPRPTVPCADACRQD
ncbi:hypothetical protein HPB51_001856 [Rhipicephalus microplus]|uniref:Uncharacterized protein n=1 Tax=Rhipicephalus microplus TaxID=6941 RepID=A0A9J6D864_RHIMP|nr:hypothetical protein HPB51_001856 [Rhipicephalus microplus]